MAGTGAQGSSDVFWKGLAVGVGGAAAVGLGLYLLSRVLSPAEPRHEATPPTEVVLTSRDVDSFKGEVRCVRTPVDIDATRFYCDGQDHVGPWSTPDVYETARQARMRLALPPGNCAESAVSVRLPAGTIVCAGEVAPSFGQPGGGRQYLVRQRDDVVFD
jgi:hypothetical protein